MYYERYGSGPHPVVGLHGWSGDHRTFEPLNPWRPDAVSLYSFDLPGYGRSAEPHIWRLPNVAEEVSDAIARLGIRKFTLVGNCSGAIIGLHVAGILKDRIEKLVLIDPFAFFPWYFKLFLLGRFGHHAYKTTFATSFGRVLTNGALRHRRTADSHLTASFAGANHAVVYRYLRMLDDDGDFHQFKGITTPIVLAYGEKTFGAVKQSVRLWSELWPQAIAQELHGAGHLPIDEASEQLAGIAFDCRGRQLQSNRGVR